MRKGVLYSLGLVIAVLVGLGLVVLFSASQVKGGGTYHDQFYFVKRQGMYLAMGMAIAVMLALVDYRVWRDHWSLTAFFGFVVLPSGIVTRTLPEGLMPSTTITFSCCG